MTTERPLDGAVSIVTGAGGQIGHGIATELAAAGSDIVVADVDVVDSEYNQAGSAEIGGASRAGALIDELESMGRHALLVECDVTDAA